LGPTGNDAVKSKEPPPAATVWIIMGARKCTPANLLKLPLELPA
jgi:hypothetical protein